MTTRTVLKVMRSNPLGLWPDAAYDEMTLRQAFLGRAMLLVNDPDMIRHVLINRTDLYRRTPTSIRLLRPLVGRGLLLSEGELWQRQRRLITPTLAPRAIPTLMRPAARAASRWLDEQTPDTPVDLLRALQGLALEIAAQTMFSMSAAPFTAEIRGLIGSATIIGLSRPDYLDMVLPAGVPAPRDAARWWFKRRWMGLISRIIAAREAESPRGDEPRDLFDLLRAASGVHGTGGRRQLRDESATLIVAGHETTALALFWACVLLADQPAMQQRIGEEAAAVDPDGGASLSADGLDQLVFTRAVISEALRLYPPAAMIVRRAIADDQCGRVAVSRNTSVVVAPWVLHRHRSFWSDPDRFDPDRFMPGAPPINRFAYLPFGAGPRVCIGASFAMAETTLALAMLLRRFEISRIDDDPIRPVVVLTTHPDRTPLFRLRRR